MPLYDYLCETCGPFTAFAKLDQYADPIACPDCTATAPRVMMNAPRLAIMNGSTRVAHATNERSADSPKRSSHGPGCACCSSGKSRPSKTLHHADGAKSFPTKRPWMISH
ncbi:FmdB family zinc ribbon protein [uncultured Roseobacter sp.]|uniref:FmdB family zinc ribbon protein n=1 Tax=uncultured Roseobacter sp. TaxID=114847 RepID=UPI00260F7FD6|nr:FmdB family zinc ribbon protein [uncultured Roseobacter sp.]